MTGRVLICAGMGLGVSLLLAGCPATSSGWTGNAEDFTYTGFDGTSGKLSDHAGRPVVVNFWDVN